MNRVVRSRLDMAARVREFFRAHPVEGQGDIAALTRFGELIGRADQLAAQQRNGVVATRAATLQRRAVRNALQSRLVRYLVAVGAVAVKGREELQAQFRLPRVSVPHRTFLTAVKAMLAKAESQRELLVSRGMSESLLADLTEGVAEFEATLEASHAGRRDHVGASAELAEVSSAILEQVRLLDGLVRYRFGDNPELMAAWQSARNVVGPPKPGTPPPTGDGTGPQPGGIAPAA